MYTFYGNYVYLFVYIVTCDYLCAYIVMPDYLFHCMLKAHKQSDDYICLHGPSLITLQLNFY